MPQYLYSLHQHTTTAYRLDLRPTTSRVVLQHPYNTMETKEGHIRTTNKSEALATTFGGCKPDRCLWTTPGLGVLIYVDDLLLFGETTKIQLFISTLKATFTLKHVTTLSKGQDVRFLGKRLQLHEDNSISTSLESSYWDNMLRPYHPDGDNVKTVTTTCLEQQPLQEREREVGPTTAQNVSHYGRTVDMGQPRQTRLDHYILQDYRGQQRETYGP